MSKLIGHVLGHPRMWLAFFGAATVVIGSGIARLELRTDGAVLRPPDERVVALTEIDRVRFEEPRQVILLVSSRERGDAVASPVGFRFLKALLNELRALPAVRASGIVSLPSLPKPRDVDGELALETLLQRVPEESTAFASLLADVRQRHLVDGLLLSADGLHAAFYLPLVAERSVLDLVAELETWLARHERGRFELKLTGPEVAEATLGRMVLRDLAVFVPVMLAVIVVLLWVVLRNIGGVLVPMGESLLVLIWTFGAMGWAGVPVTLVTTILPVILMAISITDEVHLLERLQALLVPPAALPLRRAIKRTFVELGRPTLATAVTTAVGFLSFVTASMSPVRQFGVFAAFGITVATVLSFLWVPAMIIVLPPAWFMPRDRVEAPSREPGLARWAVRNSGVALALALVVVALAAPGMLRLRVQDSWVDNFPHDAPLVQAERTYNDSFWGSYRFDVVLQAPPGFFYSTAGVALSEKVKQAGAAAPHVSGALAYTDVLEESARALGRHEPAMKLSAIEVADAAAIAEMSDQRLQLRQLLTDGGEAARVRLFVRDADYTRTVELSRAMDEALAPIVKSAPVSGSISYHFSGDLPTALTVVDAVVRNQLGSIGWTLPTVALLLFVLFARGRDALVCIVPVAASIVLILGGMGYAGMPLGIATSMFAALAVGEGVDFAIHVVERYRRERSFGVEHAQALENTVEKAGRGMWWNAVVLASGFFVLTLSSLKPNHSLGILLASAMVVCYAATFMLLPRLLRLVVPVAVLLLTGLLSPASAAQETNCANTNADPAATALMQKLETDFRDDEHIVRIRVETRYGDSHALHDYTKTAPLEKVLWGVFNGDPTDTRLLYAFSAPGRLAGTSLLLRDFADPTQTDETWVYLRSFDSFTKVAARGQRIMVPGTGLSYEDSRGFIPGDKYAFSFATLSDLPVAEGDVVVRACPVGSETRENLGYDALYAVVDKNKSLVRRVEFFDLGGKPLKRYVLEKEAQVDGLWRPVDVRIEHLGDGYTTHLVYEHWRLKAQPPAGLYEPDVSKEKFLPRLERVLTEAGLGERITKEIAASEALVRAHDDRFGEQPKTEEKQP